ncbi:hypothetical protein DYB25_006065 [Aphanomyces astaci]|uniref:Translation initiation factor IF2/IF5 domain-containing protein n=1 Tax=Aphanomyces astaci TaxID=112090 RepID=A0A397CCY5_APHAT|nr:hypothetical protein DYB25_006065 [Aphanomyces astaci]RHY42762.1 hypothetical protein DYB30_002649 [Aphanomyces astaci]RHY55405.1 hypothetical protein DYB34_002972 [Aphanomyces astaci]RHY57622.1 hypothetical protein DYB38_000727 [Aphanomyces astaci]RHY83285.1 hypothetical protein DYB26_013679 [Aphanomyces astaci]
MSDTLPVPGHAEDVAAPPAPEDVASMFDLKKKRKKTTKKKAKDDAGDAANDDDAATVDTAAASGSSTDKKDAVDVAVVSTTCAYTYEDMLDRIMNKLHENNPDLADRKKAIIKPPQLMRVGTKKTLWVNFQEICKMMHRNPEHVLQFTLSELGTEGNLDGTQRLIIRGRYVPKYIESLLRKYITEYVTCQMCRSPNTTLTRDNVTRLHFVNCQECESSRSVAVIRSGFHATTRADRRAAKK